MKLFGQVVRTAVNAALLPVTLPVALTRDVIAIMEGEDTEHLEEVVAKLKREASESAE